jgi:hypothetical protein
MGEKNHGQIKTLLFQHLTPIPVPGQGIFPSEWLQQLGILFCHCHYAHLLQGVEMWHVTARMQMCQPDDSNLNGFLSHRNAPQFSDAMVKVTTQGSFKAETNEFEFCSQFVKMSCALPGRRPARRLCVLRESTVHGGFTQNVRIINRLSGGQTSGFMPLALPPAIDLLPFQGKSLEAFPSWKRTFSSCTAKC